MKKIEKGCKAIIINHPTQSGLSVTVRNFIGEHEDIQHKDLWEIDKPVSYYNVGTLKSNKFYLAPEANLLRIDGEKFNEDSEINSNTTDLYPADFVS